MKNNPYSLVFGREPSRMIARLAQTQDICETFLSERPSQQIYMITGVRGSGKTVMMTEITKRFAKEKNWIVVELNPAKDLLTGLAAKLYHDRFLKHAFRTEKINLSFFGIGMEIKKTDPVTDIEVALDRMLHVIEKQNKRVLIAIDEVANTQDMRAFASVFQIFVRRDYPLFMLMTGLYENIDDLQNDKILTFLHRAPKIRLSPLNIGSIANDYGKTFSLETDDANRMARLTRGYSFAFQVIGHFTWEHGGDLEKSLPESRQYLEEYVYQKIWSELSAKDKQVLRAAAASETGAIAGIREELQMQTNEFSPYRDRLIKKGVLNGEERGILRFTLPFFEEFVLQQF